MSYDITNLLEQHQKCLREMVDHFAGFFQSVDYSKKNPKVKGTLIRSPADLKHVLYGPGLYLIATDVPIEMNPCTLKLNKTLPVVYRGHSSNVRERVESHLFYDTYIARKARRGFTVCMKLDGKNINIDKRPLNKRQWFVVAHSMPRSNAIIRISAEIAFDTVFEKPIGSDK
jgi:hypothetical protein